MDGSVSMRFQLFDDASTHHNAFFALWPSVAAAACIIGLAEEHVARRRLGARLLPPDRLHVSLFAVGGFVDPLRSLIVDEAKTIAGTVSMAPFEVVFDRVASFGGGGLVLGSGAGGTGAVRLHEALNLALSRAEVGARQKKPFTPHVTIAYADRAPDTGPPFI